jgi:hypothetical protein
MTQDEAGQTAASFSGRDRVYLKFTNDWTMQIDIKWTQFRLFCDKMIKITFYIDLQLITEFIY